VTHDLVSLQDLYPIHCSM